MFPIRVHPCPSGVEKDCSNQALVELINKLNLVVVLLGGSVIRSSAQTFHTRHSYVDCFTLVAYTLSPVFLLRIFDALPAVSPWATFSAGMVLAVAVLYSGVSSMPKPDASHAFGLYFTSAVLLLIMTGLERMLTLLVLQRKLNWR